MSNQVEDWFKFLWPFQNVRTLKTVQIDFFAIEIIITIHILSLKQVLPKCENWQKKSWFYITESQFSGTFFALYKVYI